MACKTFGGFTSQHQIQIVPMRSHQADAALDLTLPHGRQSVQEAGFENVHVVVGRITMRIGELGRQRVGEAALVRHVYGPRFRRNRGVRRRNIRRDVMYGAQSLIPGKVARSVFVIDRDGVITYRDVRPLGLFRPKDDDTIKAIKAVK